MPSKPSRTPRPSHSKCPLAVLTNARITAFRPGQSPPAVRMPTRRNAPSVMLDLLSPRIIRALFRARVGARSSRHPHGERSAASLAGRAPVPYPQHVVDTDGSVDLSEAVGRLASVLAGAERIVAFTGAGMSTESGIPDFRSPGGIWDRFAPIQYQDFLASAEARRETWRRGLQTYPVVAGARPNSAHLALVELERRGQLQAVVTQNIDGLHLAAGHPPERVIELHGNAHGVRCLTCDMLSEREIVHARVLAGEEEPPCPDCGGILKPTTVSFGEPMPRRPLTRAEAAMRACDLVL